ncbi:MAG: radical SAM protein [Verrucomicrobiaceae bacterium]|nr:radical SAM protein [Verrucomicrobiaceae bacterium]
MINLTRLYCDESQPMDSLRYGRGHGSPNSAAERKPIVVWNITRRCNLKCIHCYSDSDAKEYPGELNWDQCVSVIDDLAQFQIPALLLSGGEPTIHPRFFDLAAYARSKGLRLTLSTNGTLIDEEKAARIKELGFSYVGISLDGIGATHDHFRGKQGAFDKAVGAFRNCKKVGQKVGLRLTLSRHNIDDLDQILDFIEREDIERVCFYHLVPSGRGSGLVAVPHEDTRDAVNRILDRTAKWVADGRPREVLTVDQPVDGAYLYLRLLKENPERAQQVIDLLRWNGGGNNSSGTGIGNIDTQGNVHPDQFWQSLNLGNVKERPFSEIWRGKKDDALDALRNRKLHLKGRCHDCRFLDICGGGFRVRALNSTGDMWAPDPACYLSDAEIAPVLAQAA